MRISLKSFFTALFSNDEKQPIVFVTLVGGLGNQLFILATAQAVAAKCSGRVIVDETTGYWRDSFARTGQASELIGSTRPILTPLAACLLKLPSTLIRKCRLFPRFIGLLNTDQDVERFLLSAGRHNHRRLLLLGGYCQAQSFERYKSVFTAEWAPTWGEWFRGLRHSDEITWGIHCRLNWGPVSWRRARELQLPDQYFLDAFAFVKSTMPANRYFNVVVFCDDRQRAEMLLQRCALSVPYRFAEEVGIVSDSDAFKALCSARNIIASNSTFSWWASFRCLLNGGVVFCPDMVSFGQLCAPPEGAIVWRKNYREEA